MIALSVHAIFEGIATGVANDFGNFFNLAFAIILHKGAAALSLGTSMEKNFKGNFSLIMKLLTIFVFSTPIGVLLGILIGELGEIWEIIFASIAGGTFLYIACSEVIIDEFSNKENRVKKLSAYVLGFLIIFCLIFIPEDWD